MRLAEQLLGGQWQYLDSLGGFIVFSFNFGLLGYVTLTISQLGRRGTEPAVPASHSLGLTGTDEMERYCVRTFLTNTIFHKVSESVVISS